MISATETFLTNLKTQITNNIATYVSSLTAAIADGLVTETIQYIEIAAKGLNTLLQYPAILISPDSATINRSAFGRSEYKFICTLSVLCNQSGKDKQLLRHYRITEALRILIEQLHTLGGNVIDSKPVSLKYYNVGLDAIQLYASDLSIEVLVDYAD